VALVRTDGFGTGYAIEVLDVRGTLVAQHKYGPPRQVGGPGISVSWKGRAVLLHERESKLTLLDLPDTGVAAAPKGPDPAPAAPGEPPNLKTRWAAPTGPAENVNRLYVAPAGDLAVFTSFAGRGGALDLVTGKPRTGFDALLARADAPTFYPLDNRRVAVVMVKGEIQVWNEKTGAALPGLTTPELPAAANSDIYPRYYVAPNGRYVAAAQIRFPPAAGELLPLRIHEAGKKAPLVATTWSGGSVHFTADSKRMLVVESSGRCRWFKLPSGDEDGGWEFERAPGREHMVTDMSADGSVLGYNGPAGRGPNGLGPALLDGATGKPVHLFSKDYFANSAVVVSADGKRAAVTRAIGNGSSSYDMVDVPSGAPLGRASVESGQSVPPFALARDGALVVLDPHSKKLHVFEPPAAPK